MMEDIKYSKNVCILQTRDQLSIEAFSQKTLHEIIPFFNLYVLSVNDNVKMFIKHGHLPACSL